MMEDLYTVYSIAFAVMGIFMLFFSGMVIYHSTPYHECKFEDKMRREMLKCHKIKERKHYNNDNSKITLRDTIAIEAMKAEIISWNAEISDEYRAKLLEDMIKRYGDITVNDAMTKISYEIADRMIKERNNKQ